MHGTLNNPVFNGCSNWMMNQILWRGMILLFTTQKKKQHRKGSSRVLEGGSNFSQIFTDPKSQITPEACLATTNTDGHQARQYLLFVDQPPQPQSG